MNVAATYAHFAEIFVQFLGHALGQRGYQHAFVAFGTHGNLFYQIVYLIQAGTYLDYRVEQSCWAYNLLYDNAFRFSQLVVGRRGADVDGCVDQALKFVEFQGTIVERGRQAKTVIYQILLARTVAAVHGVHLRQGYVALVHHQQKVFRKIVEQAEWTHARLAPIEVARIVLDARTITHFAYHFDVVIDALVKPFGFVRFAYFVQIINLLPQVERDLVDGLVDAFAGCNENVGRVDVERVVTCECVSVGRVDGFDALYLVVPENHTQNVVGIGQKNVHRVALDAKITAIQIQLVARVKPIDQLPQKVVAQHLSADPYRDAGVVKIFGIAYAVQTRHRRYHHYIAPPRQQRRCGR